MKRMSWVVVFSLLALTIFLAGCERRTINQILAEPHRYANHEVEVLGTVTRSASVLGRGAYQIDDGTGTLWVLSDKGTPRQGARVAVRGKIKDAFDVSSFIRLPDLAGQGLVMVETEHRAKY